MRFGQEVQEMPRPLSLPPPSADTPSFEAFRAALERLDADTLPAWGVLDAAGMLRHCARFMELYLGSIGVHSGVRLLARWFGPMFLRRFIVKPLGMTPRHMKTLQSIRAQEQDVRGFEDERAAFLAAMAGVEALEGLVEHGLYGWMKAEDAKALVRHHTAHHFHQFGLL